MKSLTGLIAAASLVAAGLIATKSAQAQFLPRPTIAVSDFDEPYSALPPGPPPLRRPPVVIEEGYYESAPVIAPTEVYRVLRENGFSPLGIPRQRGPVYTISAINLANGDDGRVVIDARTGRVIRFVPAWRLGDAADRMPVAYNAQRLLPPMRAYVDGAPRPPVLVPRVARNHAPAVEVPRAGTTTAPSQRTAAGPQTTGAPQSAPPASMVAPIETKPAPSIQPTQEMPAAQGLN